MSVASAGQLLDPETLPVLVPTAPGWEVGVAVQHRGELAAFLRARRARISPADAGLPPGHRRRTPGLRREEVALLSGVGVTWYTWLEQGRPINASAQILDAVARTLHLDPTERAHLHRLAGMPAVAAPAPVDDLGPDAQEILDALAPLPACVLTPRFDVLAWNAPYSLLWRRTLAAPANERNVLWQSFMIPECCSPFATGRADELRQMVATFREAYGRRLGDPEWEELIRRLAAASAEFAAMWATHDVAPPSTRVKVYRHAGAGDIALTVTGFDFAANPELRMVVHPPADAGSRERIDWLLSHPDASPVDHTH